MAIRKTLNHQTDARLLLEDDEPVELPPAEVEESAVVMQFEAYRQYLPELLAALREGTIAEPVPVMIDGSTFAIHGATRTFWVKLWHSSAERTRIERAQIISCLPSTRGVRIIAADLEGDDDFDDDEDYDDDDDSLEGNASAMSEAEVDDERDARG